MSRRPWPAGFVLLGAMLQVAIWLVVRPDLAGPRWTDGTALETRLVLEAVVAVGLAHLAARLMPRG